MCVTFIVIKEVYDNDKDTNNSEECIVIVFVGLAERAQGHSITTAAC